MKKLTNCFEVTEKSKISGLPFDKMFLGVVQNLFFYEAGVERHGVHAEHYKDLLCMSMLEAGHMHFLVKTVKSFW